MQIFSLVLVECGWNKSWIPAELPACTSKACPDIPFPPKKIGLEYSPDERNNMTLISGKHSMKYLVLPPPHKKLKFELEKTFSLDRRLSNWSKNASKFGTALPKNEQNKFWL